MTPVQKYRDALARIPRPGGDGCHNYLMTPANLAARAGVTAEQCLVDIRAAIPEGGRIVTDGEIGDAVRKAYGDHARGYIPAPPARPAGPVIDWARYRQVLIDRAADAGEVDLWELSPVRIDWEPGLADAFAVLRSLWGERERLFLGDRFGRIVRPVSYWVNEARLRGKVPEHVCANPLDGKAHETKGGGAKSFRCDAAVCAFRYCVAEMDGTPRAEQARLWVSIIRGGLLPVAAVIDSGGKSLHGWLRVDCLDVAAWNRIVRGELYGPGGCLSGLGFDRACANPSRLSRMPGAWRADKAAWQRLLYLNPQAGAAHAG